MKKPTVKKRLKGMTLIEIIIALLFVAIAGTLMCRCGDVTNQFILSANRLNEKTGLESPVAVCRDVEALKDSEGNLKAGANETEVQIKLDYVVDGANRTENIAAKQYSAEPALVIGEGEDAVNHNEANRLDQYVSAHLDFYEIED